MNNTEIKQLCRDFIHKMNFVFIKVKPNRIDHVNKIVDIEDEEDVTILLKATIKIAFKYSPLCVHNFFRQSYEYECLEELDDWKFYNVVYDILLRVKEFKHLGRDKDIYTLFHPWINKELVHDFYGACTLFLSKMFDKYDNWFNNELTESEYKFDPAIGCKEIVYLICYKYNGCITGSQALSVFGKTYRDTTKDLDFIVNCEHLGVVLNAMLDDEIAHNKIVGKRRIAIENKIKDNFKRLPIYKDLENLGRPIKVVNCSIDRVTAYDKFVKCTVMLEIGGFEFDLIFKSEFNRRLRPLLGCYVQEISDQFYAKTLLGRPKDYRDLINFFPYDRDITYNDTKMIDIL